VPPALDVKARLSATENSGTPGKKMAVGYGKVFSVPAPFLSSRQRFSAFVCDCLRWQICGKFQRRSLNIMRIY
jgi:hypothetical protein